MQRPTIQRVFAWGLDRLYDECAVLYDPVATLVSRGRWFRWGASILPWMHAPILELGCGTGHLQATLQRHQLTSIGIDRSSRMLARARRRSSTLVQAHSQHLPFPNHSFATIAAVFPAPYILDESTLAEVERVLIPYGQLVVLMAAGAAYQVQTHPLWHILQARHWHLMAPQLTSANAPVHIIVGNFHGGTS